MIPTKGSFSLFLLFVAVPLLCQQYFGFYGGVGFFRGEGDFRQLSSIQDSIPFIGSGSSIEYNFGGCLNLPITRNIFLTNSLGIQFHSTTFSASRDFSARFDSGKVQTKYILKMDANLKINSLKLVYSPTINFNVFQYLFLRSGFSLGYEFISPKQINYTEGVFIKSFGFDTINNIFKNEGRHKYPISFTFNFGLSFTLPWNFFGYLKIGVQPYFSFGFSHIAKDFTSDIINLGLNLALQLDKLKKPQKQIEEIILPPIDSLLPRPLPPPIVVATDTTIKQDSVEIDFVGLVKRNQEEVYTPANIIITSEIYDSKVPLLGYIFFDYARYDLPKRYNKINNYNDFSYASLKNKSILDVYYNVLNIVGYRLRQHPNATITLIGCNSNVGEEMNNLELSYQRANSIAKYLISVWEIEPKRIRIEKQNLPSIFSNPKTPEGNSENQRVEIISDDPEILAPVSILDTSINISPQYLRIFAKFRNSSPKSYCKVLILNTTDTLHKKLNHPLDSFDLLIYPRFKSDGISTSVFDINLEFSSNLDSGLIINKVISLPIQYFEKRAKSQKKEKIILPPFYFNSSKINTKQIEFLNTYKEIILKAKNITLFGHTDIIGDREYNLQLSLSRGDSIEEYLINNYFSNIDHETNEIDKKNYNCTINKKALGESNTPFDNSLPEGRFFSRTVEMIIEY